MIVTSSPVKTIHRAAVGGLFFLQGICFATWASRIPSVQQLLHLTDTTLGLILFALPVGSMTSLLFSGRLVARFGSRAIAAVALLSYAGALALIGAAHSPALLALSLVLFGLAGNLSNIAINTQAVHVEALYGRSIMASFHGLWSLAGFAAAGLGSYAIGKKIAPQFHFLLVSAAIVAGLGLCFSFLVKDRGRAAGGPRRFFNKPHPALVRLGVLAFCCMLCEGTMFDWSGVYFQKVVRADEGWVGAGYTAFMCAMASGRFVADWVTNRFHFASTITASGLLIAAGLALAIAWPLLLPAIAGFVLVGFGVSSVVPLVYSRAGKTAGVDPGAALTAVSSIGFMGFLAGPPLVGLVAGATSLRVSFALIALAGLAIALLVRWLKQ